MTEATVEMTVELFRRELVRRWGVPWFSAREPLVERLAVTLATAVPDPFERGQRVADLCADPFPQPERWLSAS